MEKQIQKILEEFRVKFFELYGEVVADEKTDKKYAELMTKMIKFRAEQIEQFLSSSLRRIAREREITRVNWSDSKDEIYTYFGECDCGYTLIPTSASYCGGCGKKIINDFIPREKS